MRITSQNLEMMMKDNLILILLKLTLPNDIASGIVIKSDLNMFDKLMEVGLSELVGLSHFMPA